MILILLTSIFTVALINPNPVSAKQSSAAPATPFCCEKTLSGDFCKYTPSSNCDNNFQRAPASCSYIDFCKTGCCVLDGACSENLPKSACENNKGVWSPDSCNKIDQCDIGCCVIGVDYVFTSEAKCQKLYEPFPDLEFKFRRDITLESACLSLALAKQEGCCKVDEDTSSFLIRSECSKLTADEEAFYPNLYCSNPQVNSNCEPKAKKECLVGSDDVYWFDSCGNKEGVAEECSYDAGTICGEKDNQFNCISTDCDDSVYGSKKNGESWCEYDDKEVLGAVGSRHYRRACINGKITYEECTDFRQEICVQSAAEDGKTEAKCTLNLDSEGNNIIAPGGRFWEGIQSCSGANGQEEFPEGADSAQQQWADQKYLQCIAIGDCGNKNNWAGNISLGNYINDCKTESHEVIKEGKAKLQKNMQTAGALTGTALSLIGLGLFGPTIGPRSATFLGTKTLGIGTELTTTGYFATAFTIIAIAAVIVALTISIKGEQDTTTCTATCSTWQAPTESQCERCTEDPNKPCTEYKCRSLGAACTIVNENTPFVECTASAIDDGLSPRISPSIGLLTEEYSITETENGFKIKEAHSTHESLNFGIETDELAKCKYSTELGTSFNKMINPFGQTLYSKEHELSLQPMEFLNQVIQEKLQNKLDLYLRCEDTFGNDNDADYHIEIPLLPLPDNMPPIKIAYSLLENIQLPTHISETDFSIFLHEPAECRYSSTIDTSYEQMPFQFECSEAIKDITLVGGGSYECKTRLTNIKHNEDSNYWIKCRDQPKELDLTKRNTNKESYIFTIKSTEPLVIEEKGPEGEIFTNNPTLFVRTSGGANDGLAECGFTEKIALPYIKFFKTGFALHEQNLKNDLEKGEYSYNIQCIDSVGNIAKDKIEFNVASDIHVPIIQSIVTNGNSLILTLNEKATCQYSNSGFSFGSGTLTETNSTIHNLPNQDVLYVVCRDTSGNDAPFTLYT